MEAFQTDPGANDAQHLDRNFSRDSGRDTSSTQALQHHCHACNDLHSSSFAIPSSTSQTGPTLSEARSTSTHPLSPSPPPLTHSPHPINLVKNQSYSNSPHLPSFNHQQPNSPISARLRRTSLERRRQISPKATAEPFRPSAKSLLRSSPKQTSPSNNGSKGHQPPLSPPMNPLKGRPGMFEWLKQNKKKNKQKQTPIRSPTPTSRECQITDRRHTIPRAPPPSLMPQRTVSPAPSIIKRGNVSANRDKTNEKKKAESAKPLSSKRAGSTTNRKATGRLSSQDPVGKREKEKQEKPKPPRVSLLNRVLNPFKTIAEWWSPEKQGRAEDDTPDTTCVTLPDLPSNQTEDVVATPPPLNLLSSNIHRTTPVSSFPTPMRSLSVPPQSTKAKSKQITLHSRTDAKSARPHTLDRDISPLTPLSDLRTSPPRLNANTSSLKRTPLKAEMNKTKIHKKDKEKSIESESDNSQRSTSPNRSEDDVKKVKRTRSHHSQERKDKNDKKSRSKGTSTPPPTDIRTELNTETRVMQECVEEEIGIYLNDSPSPPFPSVEDKINQQPLVRNPREAGLEILRKRANTGTPAPNHLSQHSSFASQRINRTQIQTITKLIQSQRSPHTQELAEHAQIEEKKEWQRQLTLDDFHPKEKTEQLSAPPLSTAFNESRSLDSELQNALNYTFPVQTFNTQFNTNIMFNTPQLNFLNPQCHLPSQQTNYIASNEEGWNAEREAIGWEYSEQTQSEPLISPPTTTQEEVTQEMTNITLPQQDIQEAEPQPTGIRHLNPTTMALDERYEHLHPTFPPLSHMIVLENLFLYTGQREIMLNHSGNIGDLSRKFIPQLTDGEWLEIKFHSEYDADLVKKDTDAIIHDIELAIRHDPGGLEHFPREVREHLLGKSNTTIRQQTKKKAVRKPPPVPPSEPNNDPTPFFDLISGQSSMMVSTPPPTEPDEQTPSFFNLIHQQTDPIITTPPSLEPIEETTHCIDLTPKRLDMTVIAGPSDAFSPNIVTDNQVSFFDILPNPLNVSLSSRIERTLPSLIIQANRTHLPPQESNDDVELKCAKLIRIANQLNWKHFNALRNDLGLGTNENTPRRVNRWSSSKLDQFNRLMATSAGKFFPLIGINLSAGLPQSILSKTLAKLTDDDVDLIMHNSVNQDIFKFKVNTIWKDLVGPDATRIRDSNERSKRQAKHAYTKAREEFDADNRIVTPSENILPLPNFRRTEHPAIPEIHQLIPAVFDPTDGYVRWDEDLTTRFKQSAKVLLRRFFQELADTLYADNFDLDEVNMAAGRISAIPQVLKGEQKREYRPPRPETVIQGKTLTKERKNRIETMVGKGKCSSAMKELSRSEGQTEPPLKEILRQIQSLHNADDNPNLTCPLPQTDSKTNSTKRGEPAEIRNALNSLNSSSAPSMDGLTTELIKRCTTRNPALMSNIEDTVSFCLEKGIIPRAWCVCRICPIQKSNGTYRPIAVQHTFRKLLARLLLERNKGWFRANTSPRQKDGLSLNPNKTEMIVVQNGKLLTEEMDILGSKITPKTEVKLLGSLITSQQESRDRFFKEKMEKVRATLPVLTEINHQSHLHLLRQCLLAKPTYHLNSMLISTHLLEDADRAINDHLISSLGIPREISFLINVPLKEGGLGIPSFVQTAKPALIHTLTQIQPDLLEPNPLPALAGEFGHFQPFTESFSPATWVRGELNDDEGEISKTCKRSQGAVRALLSRGRIEQAVARLTTAQQIRYRVISTSPNQKWKTILPSSRTNKLNNTTIRISLDNLFLQPPLSFRKVEHEHKRRNLNSNSNIILCPLCRCQMREEHAQCCSRTHPIMVKRHNAIKHLIGHVCRGIPTVSVEMEVSMMRDPGESGGINTETVADLSLVVTTTLTTHPFFTKLLGREGDGTMIYEFGIDLVISQDFSSRTPTTLEAIDPKGRARDGEKHKETKYKESKQGNTIIGIGLSDNGHIGPNAQCFFDLLKQLARDSGRPNPIPPFLAAMSATLEHTRAFAEEEYLDLLRRLDEGKEATKEKNDTVVMTADTLRLLTDLSPDSIPESNISIYDVNLSCPPRFLSSLHFFLSDFEIERKQRFSDIIGYNIAF
ncbi:hypothetical protein BLNAU_14310 [Blattamonas nauphoetae]|uniref:Uncharacterized protein n=1 Tax=Blattamonas nauphoetae TaxID=2049346 RepID=A0ABQ9XE82_9EUKA|nr:hypothetical protein BLNAU_14310 [Blattamonas nauphoetae]